MRLNQFQSYPSDSLMIFNEHPDHFFEYEQPFQSPDLRPIPLPMTGYEKSPLEGMINLQNAATAFPDSNAFGQFLYPPHVAHYADQTTIIPAPQEEPDYLSDSDFGCSLDYVDRKDMYPVESNTPIVSVKPVTNGPVYASRKRKASPEEYAEPQPQKRVAVGQLQVPERNGEYYDMSGQASPYSGYVPTPVASMPVSIPQIVNNSPRPSHHYSTSNASQVSLTAPSPHTPAWSPSFTTVKTEQSPRAPMTPAPRPASTSSPYVAPHPKLVRTSTIPQQSSPGVSTPASAAIHTHTFNPYAMYPHNKDTLRLNGDLDGIALEWSAEELEARRKLIVFTRSQTGSTIDAEFKAVPQQDWQRSDITVNCIWWKERKEAFVTSVDTIALLEQLVAVRFTVEEKNRIRRNLEGFRPLTVSKARPDSEEFFKVIMGFPNPKPRNIEKDVKVFPWKILAHALKKIIGKYSASYSSTASAMITPAHSAYASTENSVDYQYDGTPAPQAMTTAMPQYNMPAVCYASDMIPARMSAPMSHAIPNLSVQVPTMPPTYDMMQQAYGYAMMPMSTYAMQTPGQPATAPPVHRMQHDWRVEPYSYNAPGPIHSSSAPPSAYPRHHVETAEFMGPTTFQIHHQ